MFKISIIIPVYNRKTDVLRCLESIQTVFDNYEVIVVDDASTDGTFELLQTIAIKNLQIFKNEKNKGVNYTRNRGIEKATGDYVLFLDSDDMLFPEGLDLILTSINEHPQTQHFLFLVSSNTNNNIHKITETTYVQWLTERVYGDFMHVIKREIMLAFPFMEEFRAYEELNWLRIIKFTQPQLLIPKLVTIMDRDRTDNLTKTLTLKSTEIIAEKFKYMKMYFQLYGKDLFAASRPLYKRKIIHAITLGVASYQKHEARKLIADSLLDNKFFYTLILIITPGYILNFMIRNK